MTQTSVQQFAGMTLLEELFTISVLNQLSACKMLLVLWTVITISIGEIFLNLCIMVNNSYFGIVYMRLFSLDSCLVRLFRSFVAIVCFSAERIKNKQVNWPNYCLVEFR